MTAATDQRVSAAAQRRAVRLARLKRRLRNDAREQKSRETSLKPLSISPTEFSELTGLSIMTVWRAVWGGEIKSKKFRDRVLIPFAEAERVAGVAGE
jgi:hypothetical protein